MRVTSFQLEVAVCTAVRTDVYQLMGWGSIMACVEIPTSLTESWPTMDRMFTYRTTTTCPPARK